MQLTTLLAPFILWKPDRDIAQIRKLQDDGHCNYQGNVTTENNMVSNAVFYKIQHPSLTEFSFKTRKGRASQGTHCEIHARSITLFPCRNYDNNITARAKQQILM